MSEKEMLRRRYEAQDAAALGTPTPPPTTPPRVAPSGGRGLPVPRAQPTPPSGSSSSRPMTAAEEKARLRAMYEAEERGTPASPPPPMSPPPPTHSNGVNGAYGMNGMNGINGTNGVSSGSHHNYSAVPPPPPLMPKPPKAYMDETLHEDVVLSARIKAVDSQAEDGFTVTPAMDGISHHNANGTLELRPFTPFNSSFDSSQQMAPLVVPPPPPLPPKVGMGDR